MAQESSIKWLVKQLRQLAHNPKTHLGMGDVRVTQGYLDDIEEQAKEMEKKQRIKDYNAGYTDAQCNHVNDADNYANQIEYLQSQVDDIDAEIKRREDKIAFLLINGSNL